MSVTGIVALIDRLRSLPTEVNWVKFKRNRHEPQELRNCPSALARNRSADASWKATGLLRGRYPALIVVGPVARAAGEAARHTAGRGLYKQWHTPTTRALTKAPVR